MQASTLNDDKLFSVVLAAGKSSRFGALKQLAKYRGRTLTRGALDLARQATGERSLLVTGAQWGKVAADAFPAKGFFVRNDAFEEGIASSIACGVRAIEQVADAVLIMLADQPMISAEHLQGMKACWQASPSCIIASEFAHTAGPPIIFPVAYFPSLKALKGDRGARALLQHHAEEVIRVPFSDAAIDIDTQDDLERID